jgi:hypothetical protein
MILILYVYKTNSLVFLLSNKGPFLVSPTHLAGTLCEGGFCIIHDTHLHSAAVQLRLVQFDSIWYVIPLFKAIAHNHFYLNLRLMDASIPI